MIDFEKMPEERLAEIYFAGKYMVALQAAQKLIRGLEQSLERGSLHHQRKYLTKLLEDAKSELKKV